MLNPLSKLTSPLRSASADTLQVDPSDEFVATSAVEDIAQRACAYLDAGYAVHFAGPPGVGKTCLAFHVAAIRGRPVTLIHGDDEFGSSDLVGKDSGFRRYKVVDNFIHSVVKTEEEMKSLWTDNRLTTACETGMTLIYDEFNRSRPEANNALLSVLSERILNLPRQRSAGQGYLAVHPEFRAIFTSNPEEYAGVHRAQDALMDRVITMNLDHYDAQTEVEITMSRSGISRVDSEVIVEIIRRLRGIGVNNSRPTVRACIAIGRVLAARGAHAEPGNAWFHAICRDVLSRDTTRVTRQGHSLMGSKVDETIHEVFSGLSSDGIKRRD